MADSEIIRHDLRHRYAEMKSIRHGAASVEISHPETGYVLCLSGGGVDYAVIEHENAKSVKGELFDQTPSL